MAPDAGSSMIVGFDADRADAVAPGIQSATTPAGL